MSIFLRLASPVLFFWVSASVGYGQASEPAVDKTSAAVKYSQEATVLEESSTKLVFENDGKYTREDSARIRVQSQAGVQRYEVLTLPYANSVQTLDIDFVRVHKPDGSVVITPEENIQDMASQITREAPFYSDLREKHIAVRGLGSGDILEFKTHLRDTKPLAPGRFWFSYNFVDQGISLHEELQISVPLQCKLKIATPKLNPVITETAKYRVYSWIYSNLEQKPKDSEEDQQLHRYQQARGLASRPDVEISNFESWDEVGRWYNDLQQERVKPTADIQAKAAQLTKGASDEAAKINAIYKYVSTEFHYIGIAFGIGRYQPHSAAEVLGNQYGDCKDKHTLLASLLAAAGIQAYPALISTTSKINGDIPSPGQFDHVITAVSRGKDILWLDSTPEVAPFGYLVTPLRGKQALLIYGDRPPVLVTTPPNPPWEASSSFEIKAKLNDSGVLEGQIERTTSGDDSEVILRSAFRQVPFPQWKDLIQQISYGSGFAGDVSEVTASSPDALDVPFRFSYKYLRKDYPDWPNRRISPPLPPIAVLPLDDDEKKLSAPVWLGAPGKYKFISEVELPKGYTANIPNAVDVKTDFADYHASSEAKDRKVITQRVLAVKVAEVPIKEFDDYKRFKKAIDDDHESYIALSTTGGVTQGQALQNLLAELPLSQVPETSRYFAEATDAFQRRDVPGQINALKRVVEIDPQFIRGWLSLGSAYMASGQTGPGLDAFHKAIDLDPHPQNIYKVLGFTLMQTKKYEEAVPIWQKLSAISPQDSDGPVNLGLAYLYLKNYKDAVTAFESALKVQPERPFLHVQLGISYLHGGSEDKAFDSFKKAIDQDPGTSTLNTVAYELADSSKKLPEAIGYAEKAVREEEERSFKVRLSALTDEDLGQTQKLAAYWDTLGWSHFRLQNYDQAARYLDGAWTLSLGGIEADHLGQTYEQQHNKSGATHMYQMALAARRAGMQPVTDESETKARLMRVAGSGASTTMTVEDFNNLRTFKLPRIVEKQASADFFLLFDSQPEKSGSKPEDVRFISGSEELKSATKILRTIDFKVHFPGTEPARIVRRGTLGCFEYTGCSIVLLTPDTVHSVN